MNNRFNIGISLNVGINAALIFEYFYQGIKEKKHSDLKNINHEMYIKTSVKELQEIYPYLTTQQIRTALDKLIKSYYIKKTVKRTQFYCESYYTITNPSKTIYEKHKPKILYPQGELNLI